MSTDELTETRGYAILGVSLAQGILAMLRGKGILTDQESDDLLEIILEGLENIPYAQDPAVQKARQFADAMAQSAVRRKVYSTIHGTTGTILSEPF